MELGSCFAYSRDTDYTIRDDQDSVDLISQTTNARLWRARLLIAGRPRDDIAIGAEIFGLAGDFSDRFVSSYGTIYPGDIVVRSRPYAAGAGAGIESTQGPWEFDLGFRYFSDFTNAQRSFEGDSSNGFVLEHTLLPDTLSGFSGFQLAGEAGLLRPELKIIGIYAKQSGGLVQWRHSFNSRFDTGVGAGYIGGPVVLARATVRMGKMHLSGSGGWWLYPVAKAFFWMGF